VNDAASAARVLQLCEGANRGEADAAFQLGSLYRNGGVGVPRDEGLALSYLRLAAHLGHGLARALLRTTDDIAPPRAAGPAPQPLARSECDAWPIANAAARRLVLDHCERAVSGDLRAYAALGELFVSGKVVARNEALAVRLLRYAAQGGNREALLRLVMMGYSPDGGTPRWSPMVRQIKR